MKEEAEHNRYFGETGVGLPDLAIHNEFGHGVFFEGDRVEDWNLGHLNNIRAKNALRLEASVATELYVQDFDESANLMGVSFDSQNALLAVKENAGIESNNSFYLGVDEKLIVDDLDLASVPLVEENRGLGLEEIGLTTEAFFKGFNTTKPNLLTPGALNFENTLSIDNSIENAGLVSSKESPEWYEAGVHNSLFANGSEIADLNTDCLTQLGVLSRENVAGLGVVSFENQSDLLGNGFIAKENNCQLIEESGVFESPYLDRNTGLANSDIFPFTDSNAINEDYLILETVNEAMDQFGKSFKVDHSKIKIDSFVKTYWSNVSDTFGSITTNIVVVNFINIEGDFRQNDVVVHCQTSK